MAGTQLSGLRKRLAQCRTGVGMRASAPRCSLLAPQMARNQVQRRWAGTALPRSLCPGRQELWPELWPGAGLALGLAH